VSSIISNLKLLACSLVGVYIFCGLNSTYEGGISTGAMIRAGTFLGISHRHDWCFRRDGWGIRLSYTFFILE
jgi:hypothetical protein